MLCLMDSIRQDEPAVQRLLHAVDEAHTGLDHGVGHPLLLLYNTKTPNCHKSKTFKDLGRYLSNIFLSLF